VMLLSNYEFCEDQYSESHALVKGVKKFCLHFVYFTSDWTTFSIGDVPKNALSNWVS
jgi:hypothetical protein